VDGEARKATSERNLGKSNLFIGPLKEVFKMGEEKERIGLELGMGWLPEYPDFRDYTVQKEELTPGLKTLGQKDSVKAMLAKMGAVEPVKVGIPTSMDLRGW